MAVVVVALCAPAFVQPANAANGPAGSLQRGSEYVYDCRGSDVPGQLVVSGSGFALAYLTLGPGGDASCSYDEPADGAMVASIGLASGAGWFAGLDDLGAGYVSINRSLVAPRTPGNDFQVADPLNPGRTITDIDTFRPGELVELKSATSAADPQAWIQKHIVLKTESYLEARQHIPGWEQADIAFEFTKPGADPAFVRSVNEAVTGLDATTPGVNITVRWAP